LGIEGEKAGVVAVDVEEETRKMRRKRRNGWDKREKT